MSATLYLVAVSGLVASLVLLAFAAARGPAAPQHRVPWIVALVVLGIDAALHLVASVGMVIAGGIGVAWFLAGTLGFLAILAVAILRPRWAGWSLLVSAVLVPLVLALGGLLAPGAAAVDGTDEAPPWPVAMVAYSVPAALSGGLLVLSTTSRRRSLGDVTVAAVPHSVR